MKGEKEEENSPKIYPLTIDPFANKKRLYAERVANLLKVGNPELNNSEILSWPIKNLHKNEPSRKQKIDSRLSF